MNAAGSGKIGLDCEDIWNAQLGLFKKLANVVRRDFGKETNLWNIALNCLAWGISRINGEVAGSLFQDAAVETTFPPIKVSKTLVAKLEATVVAFNFVAAVVAVDEDGAAGAELAVSQLPF